MLGRQLRSHLDLLLPNVADKVQWNQSLQKQTHDYHARDQQLQIDDLVLAKNHGQGPPWLPSKIMKQSGAVTFLIELTNGTVIRCHMDQLKLNMTSREQSESDSSSTLDISVPDDIPSSNVTTPEPRHCLTLAAVMGTEDKCSIVAIVSGGTGMEIGKSGKGKRLRASALL